MTWCFISPRRQNVERTNRFANAIAKEHNVPISCPSKMDDDSIVACFLDEGGLSILIRALLTYELKSQQGPDQNSQATLIQKAFDDAVVVLLPPYEARRCDLQIVNCQLGLAFYVRPCRISEVQGVAEVLEHALHLLAPGLKGSWPKMPSLNQAPGIFGQEPFNCI